MKLNAYSEYRNSGLPRVGKIPAHWDLMRVKYLLREIDDRTTTGMETLLSMRQQHGLIPHNKVSKKIIASDVLVGYKRAQPNDIVLNRMQASNGMFARTPVFGLVSPDYAVFRPIRDVKIEFLIYLFRTPVSRARFRQESKGLGTGMSGFLRLYSDRFGAMRMPLPPREEQDHIVTYIRAQDRRIAKLIRAKQRLIKLLNEQKQTIIHRAVTRGLNPDVPLKPSGIDWLGDVPAHWQYRRVKYLAEYVNGYAFKPDDWGAYGKPIIRIQNLTNPKAPANFFVGELDSRYRIEQGDILLSWSASLGVFVWQGKTAWLNQHIFKVTPDKNIIWPDYFVWLAQWFLFELDREAHGSTMQHLTKPRFGNFPTYLPSLEEQDEIHNYLMHEVAAFDRIIAKEKAAIEMIYEYRDRLFSDVVTGQIDVRGWQPPANESFGDDDIMQELAEVEEQNDTESGEDREGDEYQ